MFNSRIPQALALTGIVSLVPWPAEANNIAEYYPPGRGVCYIITNERQSYNLTKVRPGVYGVPPVCDFSTYRAPTPQTPNTPPTVTNPTTSDSTNAPNQTQFTPAPPPPPVAPAPPPPSAYQRFSGTAPVDPNSTNNSSSSPPPSAYQRYTGTAPASSNSGQ